MTASDTTSPAAAGRRRHDPALLTDLHAHLQAMAVDPAMIVAFLAAYGDRLAGVARAHLASLGRRDLARDPDEVAGLVFDIAFLLAERGGAWRPDGALPWVWAERAIRSLVARHIGHARADVELDILDEGAALAHPSVGSRQPASAATAESLAELAERLADPRLDRLIEVIDRGVADPGRRQVYVEYRLQKLCGDPSPAATVAPEFGLSATNVRQIHSRAHREVRRIVEAEDRYRDLRDLGWFAA